MSYINTENLLEWVGTFKSVSDDESCGETKVCIFIADKEHKVPFGFGSAEEISRNRVTYFDGSIPGEIFNSAMHVGNAEDLDFEDFNDVYIDYAPRYAGRTSDGYAIIFADPRNMVMPAARNMYSPEQVERLDEWLNIILGIDSEQPLVIMSDVEDNLVFPDRFEILSSDFLDEFGDVSVDILDECVFDGCTYDITWGVIDALTTMDYSGLLCSTDGVLVLLYS